MGFLRDKLFSRLILLKNKLKPISYVLFIASCAFFIFWPLFIFKNFFQSENALIVGAAQAKFHNNQADKALKLSKTLFYSIKSTESSTYNGNIKKTDSIVPIIQQISEILSKSGSEIFSVEDFDTKMSQIVPFYSILPSKRGDRKECLLLSTPIPKSPTKDSDFQSLSLLTTLMEFMGEGTNWQNHDIVFLLYNDTTNPSIFNNNLFIQSSDFDFVKKLRIPCLVRQAIDLNININYGSFFQQTSASPSLVLATEGFNGELPNFDFLFTVSKVFHDYFRFPVTLFAKRTQDLPFFKEYFMPFINILLNNLRPFLDLQASSSDYNELSFAERIATHVRYSWNMIFSFPTGIHGFLRRNNRIYAISLQNTIQTTIQKTDYNENNEKTGLLNMGSSLELVIRALNNLSEEMHVSFWFYILDSVQRVLGFDQAIPFVVGGFIAPFILQLLECCFILMESNSKTQNLKRFSWLLYAFISNMILFCVNFPMSVFFGFHLFMMNILRNLKSSKLRVLCLLLFMNPVTFVIEVASLRSFLSTGKPVLESLKEIFTILLVSDLNLLLENYFLRSFCFIYLPLWIFSFIL